MLAGNANASAHASPYRLKRVVLLWSVRSEDELALFAERLHAVAQTESIFQDVDGHGRRFVTCLHVRVLVTVRIRISS